MEVERHLRKVYSCIGMPIALLLLVLIVVIVSDHSLLPQALYNFINYCCSY